MASTTTRRTTPYLRIKSTLFVEPTSEVAKYTKLPVQKCRFVTTTTTATISPKDLNMYTVPYYDK